MQSRLTRKLMIATTGLVVLGGTAASRRRQPREIVRKQLRQQREGSAVVGVKRDPGLGPFGRH